MAIRFSYTFNRRALPVLFGLATILAVACGAAATPVPSQAPATAIPAVDASGLKTILATKVLDVGTQRVAFLLASPKAFIKVPEVQVTSVFLGEGEAASETKMAGFHLWPYGVRGSYVTEMNFDRPGPWRLGIVVNGMEDQGMAVALFEVADHGNVPNIGSIPPVSRNKTLQNTESLEKSTTDFARTLICTKSPLRTQSPLANPPSWCLRHRPFAPAQPAEPRPPPCSNLKQNMRVKPTLSTLRSTTIPTRFRETLTRLPCLSLFKIGESVTFPIGSMSLGPSY